MAGHLGFMESQGAQWWDLDARIDAVCSAAERQQAKLDRIEESCVTLGEQVSALRECLEDLDLVRPQMLLARQHRHHFARVRRRHPCELGGSLEAMMSAHERIVALAEMVGKSGTVMMSLCSRALCRSVGSAAPGLAATLPPTVYVLGGEDDDGQALAEVERLEPTTGVWVPSMPLRAPRKSCAAAAVAGQVYVVGGHGADGRALNAVDRFDPWLDIWEDMPPMLRRRGGVAAVSVGTTLWSVGGQDDSAVHDTTEVLDLATGTWDLLPTMKCPRHAAGAVQLFDRVLAIGGHGAYGATLDMVEFYDAQRGRWAEMPALNRARAGLAAAATGSIAYVIGGCDEVDRELCSVEHYDLAIGVWVMVAPLAVPRWGLGAATCKTLVYALGGTSNREDASIGACERYFPEGANTSFVPHTMGVWSFCGCLILPRSLCGATSSR